MVVFWVLASCRIISLLYQNVRKKLLSYLV